MRRDIALIRTMVDHGDTRRLAEQVTKPLFRHRLVGLDEHSLAVPDEDRDTNTMRDQLD